MSLSPEARLSALPQAHTGSLGGAKEDVALPKPPSPPQLSPMAGRCREAEGSSRRRQG